MIATEAISQTESDGRRRRREANRQAVVEALAGLHDAGHLDPTIEEIAERAGVSARSVFRYFTDLDDLISEAVALQQRRLAPLLETSVAPEGPLDDRLADFVTHRMRLLDAMGKTAHVARMRMHDQPIVAAEVTRMRKVLRDQIADTFRPELGRLPSELAAFRLAALDVLASFETHRLWLDDQGLSPEQAARVLTEALRCTLVADATAGADRGPR